jgi:hypothetical protein
LILKNKKYFIYEIKNKKTRNNPAVNKSPKQQKNGNELTENKNISDVGTEF